MTRTVAIRTIGSAGVSVWVVPVLLGLLLALTGCSNTDTMILYLLKDVTEIVDNSLDNKATVLGMAHSGGKYYAATGGSLWTRDDAAGTEEWTPVGMPAGAVSCTAFALFDPGTGDQLYAAFVIMEDDDSYSYALYKAAPGPSPTWSQVTDAATIGGKQIVELAVVDPPGADSVFVFTFDGTDTYNAYHYDGDATFGATGIGDKEWNEEKKKSNPVVAAVYDGTNYFIATEDAIYWDDTVAGLGNIKDELDNPNADAVLTDMLYYNDGADDHYYLSAHVSTDTLKGGIVYHTDDLTSPITWTASAEQIITSSGAVVPLSSLELIDTATPEKVLAGSVGYGFYETDYDDLATLARAELTATELAGSWILDYLFHNDTVFILTAGTGLWSREFSSNAWQGDNWTHE